MTPCLSVTSLSLSFLHFTQVESQYIIFYFFVKHMSLIVTYAVAYVSSISFFIVEQYSVLKIKIKNKKNITMCLSIYLLKDIWVVPGLGLIQRIMPRILMNKSFCRYIFISTEYITGTWFANSYCKCMSNFIRKQTIFKNNFT